MNYAKPQINALCVAVRAIQGQIKSQMVTTDFGGPNGTTGYNELPAYEADE